MSSIEELKKHKLLKKQIANKLNTTEKIVNILAEEIISFSKTNNHQFTADDLTAYAKTNTNLFMHNIIDWNLSTEQQITIVANILDSITSIFSGDTLYSVTKEQI